MSTPGRDRTNGPLSRRCVNCSLRLAPNLRRRPIEDLDEQMLILLRSWVTPTPVSSDDILCIECFLLLQERISSNTPPSQIEVSPPLGHLNVCFGCGMSIASRRTHRVSQDCPQRTFILRWTPAHHVIHLERVCRACWEAATRDIRRQALPDTYRPALESAESENNEVDITDAVVPAPPPLPLPVPAPPPLYRSDDSMPAVDKREFKVFCPICKTKVLHNVEGIQEDETSKIIIANVYHYFEQEYDQLTKTYEGMDLTPLLKFSERTALATGVSESTVLEILQERARRNADVPLKPARKRPTQPESSSEEDSSGGDEDDGEHSTTEHVVDTLMVKEEPETYNDEPEVYVELAGVKTEPDACGDDRDPLSVHVNTEQQSERDTTSSETVAVQCAAKRHKGSIKPRHAEAPPASCAAPSGHPDCETLAARSAAKRHKGSIKPRHAEAPPASCAAPSGQLSLPPDQQLKVDNPLTNEQGFS